MDTGTLTTSSAALVGCVVYISTHLCFASLPPIGTTLEKSSIFTMKLDTNPKCGHCCECVKGPTEGGTAALVNKNRKQLLTFAILLKAV